MTDIDKEKKALKSHGYAGPKDEKKEGLETVLQEYDILEAQLKIRRKILEDIEILDKPKNSGVLAFISSESASIDSDDIPAVGDALLSLGDVDVLNLIIESPGGDGTIAEKIISLCRSYCKKMRVIIPNRAKSAATIIALGADEVVMGYCSEIGPIDAQIPIIIDGIPHYISAQSFIIAKESLESQFKECISKKEDPRAVLQQIATLNPAFIKHCEHLMEFGRDVVKKNLQQYMFSAEPKKERNKKIMNILKQLSTVELFKVHGRMIDGNIAKTKLGINVRLLGKDNSMWKYIWGYYLRAYVLLSGRLGEPASKVIETKSMILIKKERTRVISL